MAYQPTTENLDARRWFRDAKFGLFIHWGVYAVPGGEYCGQTVEGNGEWIMHSLKMPISEYDHFAAQFNPTEFDPAEWVSLAKQAGMKYITITAKHHDGFALWDSKVSDWDVVDCTPYKRDLLKMLADECHRQGIKLFFYYSLLDWHHPDYFPRGRTGQYAGRPESGDFSKYVDYMHAQLTELLSSHYGNLAGIWFDGWPDQQLNDPNQSVPTSQVDWRLRETYDLVHKLQPQALIGSNHHVLPFEGEDFWVVERELQKRNATGLAEDARLNELPLEMCETMSNSWGYKKSDRNFKSHKQLVHLLVGAAGRGSNLLLNIGPMPNGKFPPEAITQLKQIGEWTAQYGDSLYGTRGGPITPQLWGVTTQKSNKIYAHILDSEAAHGEKIILTDLRIEIKTAHLMKDGSEVSFDTTTNSLSIPKSQRDAIDTVVVLE